MPAQSTSLFARFRRTVGNLLAPPCAGCGHPRDDCVGFCPECRRVSGMAGAWIYRRLPVRDGFLPVYAMGLYWSEVGAALTPAAQALRAFKYGGDRAAGRCIVHAMTAVSRELAPEKASIIVPIPLHRHRLRARGFNQAAWLARGVAAGSSIRTDPAVLCRTRDDEPQAPLPGRLRRSLAGPAFTANTRRRPVGSVLLVDDVLTTGTTLTRATESLSSVGIPVVAAVVFLLADRSFHIDATSGVSEQS